jgi:hypothetical protein
VKFYLLHIYGDVEPRLKGPYKSAKLRDRAAKRIRHMDGDLRDGIYRLNVVKGKPEVQSFTGGELK